MFMMLQVAIFKSNGVLVTLFLKNCIYASHIFLKLFMTRHIPEIALFYFILFNLIVYAYISAVPQ